jgi:hypothetical protein
MRRPSTAESAWVEIALLKQVVERMRLDGAMRSGGEPCQHYVFTKKVLQESAGDFSLAGLSEG